MTPLVVPLPGNGAMAARLATLLGAELGRLDLHVFPDGEVLPRYADDLSGRPVVLVCTLDHPNAKMLPLLLSADAARDLGASRVGLAAPYLCYMRQDRRFHPGEALTSRSFAKLASASFDWLVTIDPHLHRYGSLADIYSIPACAMHAAPALACWLRDNVHKPFLIGPDEESRQWVEAVARDCGAPWTVFRKARQGDQSVTLHIDALEMPPDATPVLLDDIIASGATIRLALSTIRQLSRRRAVVVAIHYLNQPGLDALILRLDATLIATNTVPGANAAVDISSILSQGIDQLLREQRGSP